VAPQTAQQPPCPNRRLARRLYPHTCIQILCRRPGMEKDDNLAIAVLDISMDGAGLFLRQPVRLGEELALVLDLEGRGQPLGRTGVVSWVVPTAEDTYCAGVRFAKQLSLEEFARLSGR
jgi:hypothetical protein